MATIPILPEDHQPNKSFTTQEQQRLRKLMACWRAARDAQQTLPAAEQAELEALVQAELRAAGARATARLRQVAP
jgi:hypothetical protein